MSTSLRKTIGFYFPNEVSKKIFNHNAIKNLYEAGELGIEDLIERVSFQLETFKRLGIVGQAEIDDVNFSFFDMLGKKKAGDSVYDFVNKSYFFDNDEGVYVSSCFDNVYMRYKHNVDWYPNVHNMSFIAEKTITTLHCGKPCLLKGGIGSQKVFYEDELKSTYVEMTGESYKKISKSEFYDFMQNNGFTKYKSPLYFMLAHASGVLNEGVQKEDFDKLGDLRVLTMWM